MTQVQKQELLGISRVAKQPIPVPAGVTVTVNGQSVSIKGPKGELVRDIHKSVSVALRDHPVEGDSDEGGSTGGSTQVLTCLPIKGADKSNMHAGTARALCNNMVIGVTQGFEKKLQMIGVGYRAQLQGNKLVLTVGKSHPDTFMIPEGISAEVPTQTEIIIRGADKQSVGQAAAKIRDFRPPEPYKGKGIRYADEHVRRKEAKK